MECKLKAMAWDAMSSRFQEQGRVNKKSTDQKSFVDTLYKTSDHTPIRL